MAYRFLLAAILTGICPAAMSQAPADAPADMPVMLGLSTPQGKACSFTAKPGEPGFCLRPVDGMDVWLRADDIWARVTVLTQWNSPPFLRNSAISSASGESGWRMPDQVSGSPAARLGESSSLLLTSPGQYQDFTLFAVGRQVPGARGGTIVSSSRDEAQSLGWSGGNAVTLRGGPEITHTLEFPGAADFHVLTVRSERGYANVFANGNPLNASALKLGERFAVQFVGISRSGEPANALAGFRGLRVPANPSHGSDIAELIIWPRALNEEEMQTTLRYLRRKYALQFVPPELGIMIASNAPAETTAAATEDESGPPLPGSSRDPLANYPAAVGRQFARTSTCSPRAMEVTDPGHCLWPTRNASAWFRADDTMRMETRLRSWSSPIFGDLNAPDEARQPLLVHAQFGRYPVVRFDDDHRMDFRVPLDINRFTIFIVGRQGPGSVVGPIFSMGSNGSTYLFWHRRAGLILGARGSKQLSFFQYEDKDKFHLLALRGSAAEVRAMVNGRDIGSQPLPIGTGPYRLGHVGGGVQYIQSREQALMEIFRDGFSMDGKRSGISSELAEILVYDRLLSPDEMVVTERYLRKKYALP